MKKSYVLVLFVMLFATTISVAQVTVKFQKPASWTSVNLYTWGPELLGGWPGAALTETDGWYTYTFDATFTAANLIFNNNGSPQTANYYTTADVCLKAAETANGAGEFDVNVVPCTAPGMTVKFQKPASWTAVGLYTYNPSVTGGWPGATLTETGGWYTFTFDATYTGGNLIFNNAGAGEQTADYIMSADVCLKAADVLNGGGQYDLSVVPCTIPGMTVNFKKPADWTNVNLYAYVNGNSIVGGWPGIALTEVNGIYSYTFDASYPDVMVIFNNGTVQLPDTQVTTSTCFQSTDGTTITAVDCSTFTGISSVKDKSLTIYPNPVADKLNFSSSSTIDRVTIYSITGKNIIDVTETANKGVVDVKSLKPGVYFVSVYFANGKQQFEKIVKR